MAGSQDDTAPKGLELPPTVDFHVQFSLGNKEVPFGLKAMDVNCAIAMATLLASSMLSRGALIGGFTVMQDGVIKAYVPVLSLINEAAPYLNQKASDMVIPAAMIKGANAGADFNKMMEEAKKLKG